MSRSDLFGVLIGLSKVLRSVSPPLKSQVVVTDLPLVKPLSETIKDLKPAIQHLEKNLKETLKNPSKIEGNPPVIIGEKELLRNKEIVVNREILSSEEISDQKDFLKDVVVKLDAEKEQINLQKDVKVKDLLRRNGEKTDLLKDVRMDGLKKDQEINTINNGINNVNAFNGNNMIKANLEDAVRPLESDAANPSLNEGHERISLLHQSAKEVAVPASRFTRLLNYGGLVAGIGAGALGEGLKRVLGSGENVGGSLFVSEANAERLVSTLSRMRGAALKLGQLLSMQDNKSIPPQIRDILERVRLSADYMPQRQREKVLIQELGYDWREKFLDFEDKPFSAASIGQVHRATIKGLSGSPEDVVVKVQYPGVAESITTDFSYLKSLLMLSNFLPKGLFLDNTIRISTIELNWECDYLREAKYSNIFRDLLKTNPDFGVPYYVPELTTKRVITLEHMKGVAIDKVADMDLETRSWVAERVLELCLKETFEFGVMQTDPNWSNFLFDKKDRKINLIDFGASREFSKTFRDQYLKILLAARDRNQEACEYWSTKIGFLAPEETKMMKDAHVKAVMILGEPFAQDGRVNFGEQDISDRVQQLIPVMLRHRLKPPPDESYSLHRKLSGAFLLCTKLRAQVRCKQVFENVLGNYVFDEENL